jgi:hypothetical protein
LLAQLTFHSATNPVRLGRPEDKVTMNKKLTLLALAAVTATLTALPAVVSAQEVHFDTATTFSGTGGASSLVAESEPTITCATSLTDGSINSGGTTGFIDIEYLQCHATVFGLTAQCHTPDALKNNEIHEHGSFHLVTISSGTPGMLLTAGPTEIICAGISNTYVEGNVIGTVTSPKCGETSSKIGLSFSATGTTQSHGIYTGLSYDLIARTGVGGTAKTAALNGTLTLTTNTANTLTCT